MGRTRCSTFIFGSQPNLQALLHPYFHSLEKTQFASLEQENRGANGNV